MPERVAGADLGSGAETPRKTVEALNAAGVRVGVLEWCACSARLDNHRR